MEWGSRRRLLQTELGALLAIATTSINPDSNASVLLRSKYNRIATTSINSLEITRIAETSYTVRVPIAHGFEEGHTVAKLERWLIAILINSPRLQVGEHLGHNSPLKLRNPPKVKRTYTWRVDADGYIIGTAEGADARIKLQQKENGVYWKVVTQWNAKKDAGRLFKHSGGIVFQANPQIHNYPWQVSAKARKRAILKDLKSQPKNQLRTLARSKLDQVLEKWNSQASSDDWIQGHQSQTPQDLWAHRNLLTNYQVLVAYLMATQQLNLPYEGQQTSDGCLQAQDTDRQKITTTHITRECRRTQDFWTRCLEHWLGHEVSTQCLEQHQSYVSARTAPVVSDRLRRRIMERHGRSSVEYEATLRRVWWAICSIGYALLWQIRNQVVHQGKLWRAPQQLEYMWTSCMRQLYAVARRERNRPETRVEGLRLQLSLDCLTTMGAEVAPYGPFQAPASWARKPEPALIKRLRTFKEAIN